MTVKNYDCEMACKDILNYYHRRLRDDRAELEGMQDALEHIFTKNEEGDRVVECSRCYQYMKGVRDKNINIAL